MAFTDNSDLYGAFHEDGFNKIIRHVMRKRPSLFNYGTEAIAREWEKRLCCRPDVAPEVLDRNNPVVTIESPIPVLGSGGAYSLNWAAQIADLSIDFHPSNRKLPDELGGKLDNQQLAVYARICAGIGCPPRWVFDEFPPPDQPPIVIPRDDRDKDRPKDRPPDRPRPDPITFPSPELACFELELYATAHAELDGPTNQRVVELVVDGIEIVDIEPAGLEHSLECYLFTLLRWVVMPRMRMLLPMFVFDLPLDLGAVTITAATGVPNNPAIEDDQLKVFVDMEVTV